MTWAALGWQDGRLILSRAGATRPLDDRVGVRDRYHARLGGNASGDLLIAGSGLSRLTGDTIAPIDLAPGLPLHRHRFRGPRVTALGQDALFTLDQGAWVRHDLPDDIDVQDADIAPDGSLWAVGSVVSDRLPGCDTEAAIRVRPRSGVPWRSRSPHLGPIAAMRASANGGLADLRTVDVAGTPVVLTSLCAWFIDDESSFLFSLAASPERQRDRVTRLADDVVCHVDRPVDGVARAWTAHGQVWTVNGRHTRGRSLREPLLDALDLGSRHLVVRSVAADGDRIALAVEVAEAGRSSEADDGEYTAICLSSDEGRSFHLAALDRVDTGPEWCGVAL